MGYGCGCAVVSHCGGGVLQCYRDLTLVNRDGMNVILVKINQILMEKFLKLQDVTRTQVNPHCTVYMSLCVTQTSH